MDVSNSITQYSPLGPIGGSTGYTPHLHLCTLPLSKDVISDTENKNPLEFIDYTASGYNIEVRSELNTGGITLKYPGTQITSLRIRPKLLNEAENDNRYNQIYDVNKVKVLIQKPGESTYEKLKGFKSDLEIDLGGKLGTTLINHTKEIKGGADNYGSWTQYGINSFAYNTGAKQAYDDFYLPDFVTRLHKAHVPGSAAQYTSCPAEAKYPDGRYKLKARVISISGDSTDSAVSPFLLDNYKPYISQVIMSVKGKQCYDAGWECSPCGGLKYAQSPGSPYSLDTLKVEGMRIRVKTSEPLASLRLTIAFYSKYNLIADAVSTDSTEWIFNTGAVTDINADSARVLRFTGTDQSGNSLLNLSGYKDASCVKVPVRMSNTEFLNESGVPFGKDESHIIPCHTIKANVLYTVTDPSDCNIADGSICIKQTNFKGGIPEYDTYFYDEKGNLLPPGFCGPTGLLPGEYSYKVKDGSGCINTVEVFKLYAKNSLEVLSEIQSSCPGVNVGSIGLGIVSKDNKYQKATFVWSNGQIFSHKDILEMEHLASGHYTVTITPDSGSCVVIKEYDVGIISGPKPELLSMVTTNPCHGASNGSMELKVQSLLTPLLYSWLDGTSNTLPQHFKLAEGKQCVTITDYCMQSIDTCYLFKPVEVILELHPGCEKGSITAQCINGNAPYTYNWTSGTAYFSNNNNKISDAVSDVYIVYGTDHKGCKYRDTVELHNTGIETEIIEPCQGSNDGKITIHIYNNQTDVSGTLIYTMKKQGSPPLKDTIQISEGIKHYYFTLQGISSGSFNAEYHSGNCDITLYKKINEEVLVKEFEKNIADTCFYTAFCKGNTVTPEGKYYKEWITKKYNGYGKGFFGSDACELDLYCNDTYVGKKSGKSVTTPIGAYKNLLNLALTLGYSYKDPSAIASFLADKDDCDKVTFCDLTLIPTMKSYNGWKLTGFFSSGQPKYEYINEHCKKVICPGVAKDYIICNDNPELIEWVSKVVGPDRQGNNKNLNDCNFRTQSVIQLVIWLDSLKTQANFTGSQLDSFLNEYKEDKRAVCAEVTFCKNSFEVLHSNINSIDCDAVVIYKDSTLCKFDDFCKVFYFYKGTPQEGQYLIGYCKIPNCNEPIKGDCDDFLCEFPYLLFWPVEFTKGFRRISGGGVQIGVCDIVDVHQTWFDDFAFINADSILSVKGIFKNDLRSEYYDYHPSNVDLSTDKADRPLVYYYFDMDSVSQRSILMNEKEKNYAYVYTSDNLDKEISIKSSEHVVISKCLPQSDYTRIVGSFQGNLQIGQEISVNVPGDNIFYFEMGEKGEVKNFHIIQNTRPDVIVFEEAGQLSLRVKTYGPDFIVDGIPNQLVSQDSSVIISIDSLGLARVKASIFQTTGQVKLLKVNTNQNSKVKTFVFSGTGTIFYKNQFFFNIQNSTKIMTIDSTDQLIWQKQFSGLCLQDTLCDAAYTEQGDYIFGFTSFTGFEIDNNFIDNKGTADIHFYKFNQMGQLLSLSYETKGFESVKRIFVFGNAVIFGGTLSTKQSSIIIGHNEFLNKFGEKYQAYMSYLLLDDFAPAASAKNTSLKPDESFNIRMYPNPTTGVLRIELPTSFRGDLKYRITTVSGVKILERDIKNSPNIVQISEFSYIGPGLYFVEIFINDIKQSIKKIIKF